MCFSEEDSRPDDRGCAIYCSGSERQIQNGRAPHLAICRPGYQKSCNPVTVIACLLRGRGSRALGLELTQLATTGAAVAKGLGLALALSRALVAAACEG